MGLSILGEQLSNTAQLTRNKVLRQISPILQISKATSRRNQAAAILTQRNFDQDKKKFRGLVRQRTIPTE
jgi:hypothetical protein